LGPHCRSFCRIGVRILGCKVARRPCIPNLTPTPTRGKAAHHQAPPVHRAVPDGARARLRGRPQRQGWRG
jgi:hypothetical protein